LQSSMEHNSLTALRAKQAAIKSITGILSSTADADVLPILDMALEEIVKALQVPVACLHLADPEYGLLKLITGFNMDPVFSRAWTRLNIGGVSLQAQVFEAMKVHEQTGTPGGGGMGSVICAPISGNQEVIGTLSLMWPSPHQAPADEDRVDFLETVGQLLGLALEHAGLVSELVENLNRLMRMQVKEEEKNRQLETLNQELRTANQQLEELSMTDSLTGLANRRQFLKRLEHEIARANRLEHPICLVMADLDHFKQVNDRLGHQAGDQALMLFAGLLSNGVRQIDIVGRYGGEEFCMVLVNCDLISGVAVADKFRRQFMLKSMRPPFEQLGGITVSMGVAQLNGNSNPNALIGQADKALYLAKQNGRNRVEAAR
jgi:diguanylate cyclase (GGDEF)-like protein